jgi:glycosyltransferase involved in cell wall biosynthesis
MKIVILVHNLTGGGAERVAALWTKGLCKKGYDVCVILFDDKSPVTYSLPKHVKVRFVVSHKKNRFLCVIDRIIKLHKTLKYERPDVVIDVMPDYWKRAAMSHLKCYKISTEHWSFERPKDAPIQPKKIKKIYLNRLYDHVTVLTQADKNVIGSRLKRVTVLPNPLAFEPMGNLDVSQKEKVVLAVGRLDAGHVKGFDVLIKAFSMAKTDWSLQIAGTGTPESLSRYKELARVCGVEERVQFLGFINDPIKLYQKASIFVLSSRYEAFGLVVIEAMSQGCACIACDYKGRQREIITNGVNGIICKPDDIEGIASALTELTKNENKRKQLGLNAIERSKDFSVDKIADRWEQILSEFI